MSEVVLTYDTINKKFSGISKVGGSCQNTPLDSGTFFCQESKFDLVEDNDVVDISSEDWTKRCILGAYIDGNIVPSTDGITFGNRYDFTTNTAFLVGKPNSDYVGGLVIKYICFS